MSATTMIMVVGLTIASMAFIFVFSLLKENKVDEKSLRKVLGDDVCDALCKAESEEEMKKIIRGLKKSKKWKLKTLLESQDIRDVIKAVNTYLKKPSNSTQD